MNPKRGCGVRDPFLVARVGLLDIELLEFFERFIQHDVPVKHIFNYSFQAGTYLHSTLSLFLCQQPERERGQL